MPNLELVSALVSLAAALIAVSRPPGPRLRVEAAWSPTHDQRPRPLPAGLSLPEPVVLRLRISNLGVAPVTLSRIERRTEMATWKGWRSPWPRRWENVHVSDLPVLLEAGRSITIRSTCYGGRPVALSLDLVEIVRVRSSRGGTTARVSGAILGGAS